MRKLFILISLLILFCLPVFAEYTPIPKELSKQYKVEMEQIIDNNYQKIINDIDDYYKEVIKTHYEPEVSIYDLTMFLYSDLMKVTQEKYLGVKYSPYCTDSTYSSSVFLYQYFKDNNVDTKKIDDINQYARSTDIKIHKFLY